MTLFVYFWFIVKPKILEHNMSNQDFFANQKEHTRIKLELFQKYLHSWLFVFLNYPKQFPIQVFDFFSGPGKTKTGELGSPLVILEEIARKYELVITKNKPVYLWFNDVDKNICQIRSHILHDFVEQNDGLKELRRRRLLFYNEYNDTFLNCFSLLRQQLSNGNSLVFLDQFGVKHINNQVFRQLLDYKYTDFFFFISTGFFVRFGKLEITEEIHPGFPVDRLKSRPFGQAHLAIRDYYQEMIPSNKKRDVFVFPFSLKANNNYYGMIFCTQHIKGADEFLKLAWGQNPLNGQANYDIHDDENRQPTLFRDSLSKVDLFEKELRKLIQDKVLSNNLKVYEYSLHHGFPSKIADEVVRKMKQEKNIDFSGRSLISYSSYKDNKVCYYTVNDQKSP